MCVYLFYFILFLFIAYYEFVHVALSVSDNVHVCVLSGVSNTDLIFCHKESYEKAIAKLSFYELQIHNQFHKFV